MDYTLLTSLSVNIAAFSVGTAITWSSPMIEKLKDGTESPFDYKPSKEELSWISAFCNLGAAVTPFIFGNLVERIGRKYAILGLGFPLVVGFLIMAFVKSVTGFYIGRFLCGLSTGGVFNIIPIYLGEIADDHNRGTISSILNLLLCAGMLFSYCVGPYVSVTAFNIILSIFPIIFIVSFFIIGPESPYFYVKIGKNNLAKEALQKLRGRSAKVDTTLEVIVKSVSEEGTGNFFDIFKSRELKRAFVITLLLLVFQQFSGIIAIIFYAQTIFEQAGVNLDPAICSILLGAVQFVTSFTTPLFIDKLGRKMLLMISAVGMFVSETPLSVYNILKDKKYDVSSVSMLPIVCLIVYIITYNFGFGPLPWTVMGELFPTNVKSTATIFLTFFCWTLAFLVAKYFETVVTSVGIGVAFSIFAGCCGISIICVHFFVIETKGKSLQEIRQELAR